MKEAACFLPSERTGGFVLPCSSVRLIRYYRTADDTEEDFYAHF